MEPYLAIKPLIATLVYSIIGVLVLAVSFWVFDRITPGKLWHHIVEDKNLALGVTAAAMILGIAIIIAAAITG